MALPLSIDTLDDLPRTPASDVKKLGWRGVMKSLGSIGKVVVTNHNRPEAVILSAAEYDLILRALQQAAAKDGDALDALRHRFDARLASLQDEDAGDRLRGLMDGPARLGGKVRAGTGH